MIRRVPLPALSVAARLVAIVGAAASVLVLAHAGARLWPPLWPLTAVAALFGYACGRWLRPALGFGLALVFLSPALFFLVTNNFFQRYHAVWLAMLLGAAIAARRFDWSLPPVLRLPAAGWAVTVALTAAIVSAREVDFTTLTLTRAGVSAAGAPPAVLVDWIALVAAGLLVGILWLDYLFAAYAPLPFRRFVVEVLLPLAAGTAISAAVGLYQTYADPTVLRPGFWRVLGRATGTVRDANGFGALCALWGPALAALAIWWRPGGTGWILAIFTAILTWAGVWVSGSRGAFLVATAATGALLVTIAASARRTVAALIVVVAIGGGAVGVWLGWTSGPLKRVATFVTAAVASPRQAALAVWERDGYGVVADRVARDRPLAGVGIGMFHSSVRDYSPPGRRQRLPPDNAQNWYRHQLAEFGILGSVAWMVWVVVVVSLLVTARRLPDRTDVTVVRWVLVAFGVVSTVSMPGQELFVSLTFWTLLFWYLTGVRMPEGRAVRLLDDRASWTALWAVALVYASVVAVQAVTTMRPPVRAARHDRDYTYGFRVDRGTLAWSGRHAVTTLRTKTSWMKLTCWVNHPDADERPVSAAVWVDREQVIDRRLRRGERITRYVRVPGGGRRVLLEVKVDRTFRPADYGSTDRRELGLAMTWEFVNAAAATVP